MLNIIFSKYFKYIDLCNKSYLICIYVYTIKSIYLEKKRLLSLINKGRSSRNNNSVLFYLRRFTAKLLDDFGNY